MRTLTTTLILFLLAGPAAATEIESDLFLVEVIVFTHAGADPRLRPGDPSDTGNAVDVELERERRQGQPRNLSARNEVPEQYVAQNGLSASMDGVWRRLQQSGGYRPLARRSWYQHTARNERTRAVLIHDAVPLFDDGAMRFGRKEYRLEGTLGYRRDRFHRLALDIVWRQADGDNTLFERLTQRRSIRPGRLEYFDGPWLSALVLVTPWEPPAEAAE